MVVVSFVVLLAVVVVVDVKKSVCKLQGPNLLVDLFWRVKHRVKYRVRFQGQSQGKFSWSDLGLGFKIRI